MTFFLERVSLQITKYSNPDDLDFRSRIGNVSSQWSDSQQFQICQRSEAVGGGCAAKVFQEPQEKLESRLPRDAFSCS
jgi:hypothetical protein